MSQQLSSILSNNLQDRHSYSQSQNQLDHAQNQMMASFGNNNNNNSNLAQNYIAENQGNDYVSWKSVQTFGNMPPSATQSPALANKFKADNFQQAQRSDEQFNSNEQKYASTQSFMSPATSPSTLQHEYKISENKSQINQINGQNQEYEYTQFKNGQSVQLSNQQLPSFQQTSISRSTGQQSAQVANSINQFGYVPFRQQQQQLQPASSSLSSGNVGINDPTYAHFSNIRSELDSQKYSVSTDKQSQDAQQIIAQLQYQLDLKDKAIQNTYSISFLANRNQPIDLMEMIEKYVLICAENEKLSFGFIEKLQQMDSLSVQVSELTKQKENWKTLYENKASELLALSKEYENLRDMLQEMQTSSQDMQGTLHQLQSSKQNSEKEQQILIEENQNIRAKLSELLAVAEEEGGNIREQTNSLQEKLIKILGENEELNRLLSERVDEVAYLQETIKQLQETYSNQQSTDSRFQKVIKDLEAEIRRMDERVEELIREKDYERRVKAQIEEENNELRVQLQQKRKELEESKISSKTSQITEVTTRKKQEQIEELLLKIERMERSKNESQQQTETFKAELFQGKEQLKKLEKRYEDKSKESMELLVKNTELNASIKQLKTQKDTSFIEKDLQQASFEKKQLQIQINELQYEQERARAQLEAARKEIESLTKQQLMQKQKSVDREMSLQDEIQRLKYDQTKDQEGLRCKAKIEVQEELITNLQAKFDQAEQVIDEQNLELEEKKLLIKELRAKLDRISVIEGTLHAADKENTELSKFKEDASAFIEDLKSRILKISIENERLHNIVEESKNSLEAEKEKAERSQKFSEVEIVKIEEEIASERAGFQKVIQDLEFRLSGGDRGKQGNVENYQDKYKELEEQFLALKGEFELAIETLKQRDQQILYIEGKYNQLAHGDRNSYVIKKLEEKLQILAAENLRLNKILVDRVRFSQSNW